MFSSFKRFIFLYSFLLFATVLTLASASVQTGQILLEDIIAEGSRGSGDDIFVEEDERSSLFWRAMRYYISYAALSANRVPCPPRSGRSYYTHNCFKERGPAHPYYRPCSVITRCRR